MKTAVAVTSAALVLAATSGFLASTAFSTAPEQATRTVTVTLRNGATGPAGPRGPTGPAGAETCPAGFSPGELVINHPGGQVTVFSCLKD